VLLVEDREGANARRSEIGATMGGLCVRRFAWTHACTEIDACCRPDTRAAIVDVGASGARLVEWLEAHRPGVPVLALLSPDLAPELVKRAAAMADDFAMAPLRARELELRMARLLELPGSAPKVIARRLSRTLGMRNMVGENPAFQRLVASLPRVAASDATVLITGETGTGKELYARAIHHLGPRHDRSFVAVDCGAFPDHLMESELFGHAAGAFTDARGEHRGLARMAEGGVLFLDEVDGLSLAAQGKLLRFLQERTFKPLGDERARQADVRVIAATNRDLPALVKEHRFRADLYFRFSVLPVHIMPLRERRSDIPVLARHFVEEHAPRAGRALSFTDAALERLAAHDFPGNVRELHNLVQRAVVMVDGDRIDVPDLVALGLAAPAEAVVAATSSATFRLAKARAVETFERDFVARLLGKHGGNITRASREARTDRRAFGRLVKKHGLQRAAKEAPGAPGLG